MSTYGGMHNSRMHQHLRMPIGGRKRRHHIGRGMFGNLLSTALPFVYNHAIKPVLKNHVLPIITSKLGLGRRRRVYRRRKARVPNLSALGLGRRVHKRRIHRGHGILSEVLGSFGLGRRHRVHRPRMGGYYRRQIMY